MNVLAAFLLGLAGSLHCALMCGPLVLAVNAARRQSPPNTAPPYFGIVHQFAHQAGRLMTYCLLGAVSGLVGATLVVAGFQRWLSIAAGCLVLFAALSPVRLPRNSLSQRIVSAAKARFGGLLRDSSLGASLLLGGLNGLLPCGLVYVACAAAVAAGNLAGAVGAMLAFGLGTVPMMLSAGLLGKLMGRGRPRLLQKVVFVCGTVAGLLLILRGLSLGIPYLSPQLSDGICNCRHTL